MTKKPTPEQRLAAAVRARRLALGSTQAELAAEAGVSDTTWNTMERGLPVSDLTLVKASKALGWTPESAQGVLDGADPVEAPTTQPSASSERLDALEARMDTLERLLLAAIEREGGQPPSSLRGSTPVR